MLRGQALLDARNGPALLHRAATCVSWPARFSAIGCSGQIRTVLRDRAPAMPRSLARRAILSRSASIMRIPAAIASSIPTQTIIVISAALPIADNAAPASGFKCDGGRVLFDLYRVVKFTSEHTGQSFWRTRAPLGAEEIPWNTKELNIPSSN